MQGEVVLVTGGSSGIGLAAARRFVERGARVWLVARDAQRLEQAASSIGSAGAIPADITDPSSVQRLVQTLREREGRLDVLVNSAGQFDIGHADADAAEMLERLLRVNCIGPARLIAAALPLVEAGSRKSIVNLSSVAGKLTPPFWSAYSASKYALQAYTHSLRQELRARGIHVGLVLPGPVESPMIENHVGTPMYPLPVGVPVVKPDRVAQAILECIFKRRAEVVVPNRFRPIVRVSAAFPGLVDLFYRRYTRI
jgi:short-subunit dehydrogenase